CKVPALPRMKLQASFMESDNFFREASDHTRPLQAKARLTRVSLECLHPRKEEAIFWRTSARLAGLRSPRFDAARSALVSSSGLDTPSPPEDKFVSLHP